MGSDLAPDWILKQALAANSTAHQTWLNGKPELDDHTGMTLTVLGCGTMGIAILSGILDSIQETDQPPQESNEVSQPERVPTKFIACVRSHKSAEKVRAALNKYNARLSILENDNLKSVERGDVVLLSCQPEQARQILQAEGIREALRGKILVSICANLPEEDIHSILYGTENPIEPSQQCSVVRAVPNAAAIARESMTVISVADVAVPAEVNTLVTWIFTRVGRVRYLPTAKMQVCSALCASGPAFASLMLESLASGAMHKGLPREDAYIMAAQTMRGTAEMILQGEHPAVLRDKVSTVGECTFSGLAVLEENAIRETIAKSVRETTGALR